jgi:subtilase family serine protease
VRLSVQTKLRRRRRGAIAVALATSVGVISQSAVAGATSTSTRNAVGVRLERMAPRLPLGSVAVGSLPGTTAMTLSVTLAPRNEPALTAFIAAASIPGSAAYRHYLAAGQFALRFGPSARTVSAVENELRSLGMGRAELSSDHLFVTVHATATSVESAFGIALERYRLPDGSVGFINTQAPRVSGVLESPAVVGILGLDSLSRPRPLLYRKGTGTRSLHAAAPARLSSRPTKKASGPQACATAVSTAKSDDSYTDTQIAEAYKLNALYAKGDNGKGQTVALYELEPFSSSDLATFQKCYGTAVPVTVVKEFGGAGSGFGSGESILDIDNIVAMAPGIKLLVYEGPGNTDAQATGEYDDMVAPDNAKSLSTSWGLCEQDEGAAEINSEYPVFQEAAVYGQTLYAAAGDDGSEDCLQDGTSFAKDLAVDDPGSDPYVVSVGGLRLQGLTPTEAVWNDKTAGSGGDGDGAGGGGISTQWLMPTWQIGKGVINKYSSHALCGATTKYYCREVPDVSADADPDVGGWVFYYEGSWQGGEGGTSAAAPLWAAMTAVINAQCPTGGVGFDAPRLYAVARTAGNFTDVTSGNNDYTGGHSGSYPATADYDMASGLGSPLATGLATSLC